MKKFNHLILTRFNISRFRKLPDPQVRLKPEWLAKRFQLFDKFCHPSVFGQKNQDFKWLVFFDSRTPDEFKEKIHEYTAWENFIPIYKDTTTKNSPTINRDVMDNMDHDAEYLITTRLDNDDAISDEFIQNVHRHFREQEFHFINFTHGYQWNNGRLYKYNNSSNPFISLVEKMRSHSPDGFKTVFCGNHTTLSSVGPIEEVNTPGSWLQVIHDSNAVNKVSGIRCSTKGLLYHFNIDVQVPKNEILLPHWIYRGNRFIKKNTQKIIRQIS